MSPSSLLGAAGEHYVMPQLLRRGFIAALAPVGVPIADIVITNDAGERACALQVKTRREIGSDAGWHRKARHEGIRSASLFYVFLPFRNDLQMLPDAFVILSAVVADALLDWKNLAEVTGVAVWVDIGGGGCIKKKKK